MSNEQLSDRVREALRASGYGQLRHLQVNCDRGRVTLNGCVPTAILKQTAELIVYSVTGVDEINNELSVIESEAAICRTHSM